VTTARKADPIRRMTTKCGETRCLVIDVGKRLNGKRDQRCYTYTKWEEARAARVKIIADPWSGRDVRLRRCLWRADFVSKARDRRSGWVEHC
jgi:hypothetical protein